MAKKKPSRVELETELRVLRRSRVAQSVTALGQRFLTVAGAVWIAYFVNEIVQVLAGRATVADFGLRIFTSFEINVVLAWAFGILGVGFGIKQRNLRRGTALRLGKELRQHETEIDPNRSSSRLEEAEEWSKEK